MRHVEQERTLNFFWMVSIRSFYLLQRKSSHVSEFVIKMATMKHATKNCQGFHTKFLLPGKILPSWQSLQITTACATSRTVIKTTRATRA